MIDFEETEQMHHLVSVGTASVYSQLLHFKRQTVFKENLRECELSPKVRFNKRLTPNKVKYGDMIIVESSSKTIFWILESINLCTFLEHFRTQVESWLQELLDASPASHCIRT